jgi:hypothetical protein
VDMDGFKNQQHRWTKGSVQTCKKLLGTVWNSDIPFILKLESTVHLTSNFAYLLLILLLFLVFPDMQTNKNLTIGGQINWRVWLVDIPVFVLTTGSVCLFYITAQRALFPKSWWRELMYLPALLALGVGMSINNGRAVLEAIFNQESPFVRTPKYGIEGTKTANWKKKGKYKALKSFATGLEILLACYFTGLTILALYTFQWTNVPFLALFMLGFWYVAIGTLPGRAGSAEPVTATIS